MLRPLCVIAATSLLIGLSPAADDPPGPKIEVPDVKGLTRRNIQTYSEAGLGYSVGYNAPGFGATVYAYNRAIETIPAGAASEVVKNEVKRAADEIDLARQQGAYKSVKELGMEETVRLGKAEDAPAALRRRYEIEWKDGTRLSEAYVTGYKNHFVKIRITHAPDDKTAPEKIAALLEALGPSLK
ncbi:hypothetical protein [Frigoriglobus tundricola]|uniref:Uncharacterized protein n=1 Tax=Frigoriglobus tundricola TaxID=2774151 RepID=A0A6M5YU12_9BACT|nr:hypothetical protein [Frigoriglobus tundricola]QJW96850.1 hypothetical protein FTUN_4410 [Frigoriglobus tundricola]